MSDDLICWRCGQHDDAESLERVELVHDAEHDISVPLCLDCRTGWTETVAAMAAFSEAIQRTARLMTGRERGDNDLQR